MARCSITPESLPMEYNITGIAEFRRNFPDDADGLGLEPLQIQR